MARKDKKETPAGVNPKNVQAFDRLAFLHQASILMSTTEYTPTTTTKVDNKVKQWHGDPPGKLLGPSRYFNNNMKQITSRLVMRLDPSVKRTVCKRCETTLLPAITSNIRIISKPVPTAVTICKICKKKKKFTSQTPNYVPFSTRSDVVLDQSPQ